MTPPSLVPPMKALFAQALLAGLTLVVGLAGGVAIVGAPAFAQLTVAPEGVNVTVPQHGSAVRTVTLTNMGSGPLTFCLSFDRPLQRTAEQTRLAEGTAGGGEPCRAYGEVLYRLDDDDVDELGWDPYGLTMTPGGQPFVASLGSALHRTFELTPALELVGFFEHPHVAELTPFSSTPGVTYDTESGTLWWMNTERAGGTGTNTRRVLLLEGALDGESTGRRIEIVPPDAPVDSFSPGGLAYDPATDRFYFAAILGDRQDPENRRLWAVDREGAVPEGYPLVPEPEGVIGLPDVHGGVTGGPEGVRVEYGLYPPFGPNRDRIVVVDRWGEAQGEELETPVPPELFESGGTGIRGNPLRSRVDPNGVMYMTFTGFDDQGIVGVRPHPLPPSWLVVDSDEGSEAAWDGELDPGESRELELTFRAGAREVGAYTSALQAFEAESGAVVEVPLVLEVTVAEGEGASPEASSLAVYPTRRRGRQRWRWCWTGLAGCG